MLICYINNKVFKTSNLVHNLVDGKKATLKKTKS
jgi:hypothetical protein